ncbi:hypothetical protein ACVWZV_002224 [Bradyrhizobium sp. GM5.1]
MSASEEPHGGFSAEQLYADLDASRTEEIVLQFNAIQKERYLTASNHLAIGTAITVIVVGTICFWAISSFQSDYFLMRQEISGGEIFVADCSGCILGCSIQLDFPLRLHSCVRQFESGEGAERNLHRDESISSRVLQNSAAETLLLEVK